MIEQLENFGLYLNQPEPAIICIQCKFALKADGDRVSRHLGERHGISKPARRGLGPFIRTLRLPDPETWPVRSDGSPPHPHLRIQQGAACRHCGFRSTSLEVLSRHIKKGHSIDIQNSRARSFPNSTSTSRSCWLQDHILDRLSLQTWTAAQDPDTPATIYRAPVAIQIFTRELYAKEQQYISRQAVEVK
ncbi:hypothetical protein NW761_015084 [Fusarium oxysporum]|nr:hypothetical protein NW758_015184 [Fusarium oxysporum]KAJ4070905.1 hypothetical protein NW761_015084 [Fusarium oxysporum]